MEKIKKLWKTHKRKIIIGGFVGAIFVFIFKQRALKKPKLPITTEEMRWVFDNLDDAIHKFKGLETAIVALELDEAVKITEKAGEYVVIFSKEV